MSTPTEVHDVTALVPAPKPFDMATYLDGVANDRALQAQQQLVIAYDKAVRSLVGPNDVQKEGGREFKKKSAWRKLARYFQISTEIVREETHRDAEGHLVSTVVVRATAPWGQYAEAIAKCSTRERRFSRDQSKADHDCPATAQTRATNRAVSDLIAAGEVSAEEMEFGEVPAQPSRPMRQVEAVKSADKASADKKMPFGKHKGTRLADIPTEDLDSTVNWCREKDAEKFADLIAACVEVMQSRPGVKEAESMRANFDEMPAALQNDDDELPF